MTDDTSRTRVRMQASFMLLQPPMVLNKRKQVKGTDVAVRVYAMFLASDSLLAYTSGKKTPFVMKCTSMSIRGLRRSRLGLRAYRFVH